MFYIILIGNGLGTVTILLKITISKSGCFFTCEEYWKQLVDIKAPLSTDDIVCLISNALVILFSVLSYIVVSKRKKLMACKTVKCCFSATVIVVMSFTGYSILTQAHSTNRLLPALSDVSRGIRSQLNGSLNSYIDGDDAGIHKAWVRTMKDGCCCGVDGYTDFLDLGAKMPEYCICTSNMTSNSSAPRCYGSQLECDAKNNLATKGCYGFIINKIQLYKYDIRNTKICTSMFSCIMQYVVLFLSMYSLSYYFPAPKKPNRVQPQVLPVLSKPSRIQPQVFHT